MRSLLSAAAVLLGAAIVTAGPIAPAHAYGWGWGAHAGAVYDGPYPQGPHDAGSYRGAFARAAHPGASRCVAQRRARSTPQELSYYTVRVCR